MDPRAEDGISLVLALAILVLLSITTVTAMTMALSSQETAASSLQRQAAEANAEAGVNNVESILYNQVSNGGNPSAANLLGCAGATGASDVNGPSNCSRPTPAVLCITAASGCAAGSAGSASVYGYFSGANPGSYLGITVPASTWLMVSTGYVRNPNASGVMSTTAKALVKITPLGSGAVAAVWNHMFLTAPLVNNVCQTTFTGNNLIVDTPVYAIGNICVTGNNNQIEEVTDPPWVSWKLG